MAERGELTLKDAASRLGVSTMTVLRLIRDGTIDATQICKGVPWAIPDAQLESLAGGSGPRTADQNQEQVDYR